MIGPGTNVRVYPGHLRAGASRARARTHLEDQGDRDCALRARSGTSQASRRTDSLQQPRASAAIFRQSIIPPLRVGLIDSSTGNGVGELFPQPEVVTSDGTTGLLDAACGTGWRLMVDRIYACWRSLCDGGASPRPSNILAIEEEIDVEECRNYVKAQGMRPFRCDKL